MKQEEDSRSIARALYNDLQLDSLNLVFAIEECGWYSDVELTLARGIYSSASDFESFVHGLKTFGDSEPTPHQILSEYSREDRDRLARHFRRKSLLRLRSAVDAVLDNCYSSKDHKILEEKKLVRQGTYETFLEYLSR